ncbi:MAG: HEAT repeat domain-containing protein [Planctomycetota bacterium]
MPYLTRPTPYALIALAILLPACAATPPAELPRSKALIAAEPAATTAVLNAARSDNARLRANALEALAVRPQRALALAQLALEDPNPVVRYVAYVTIGQQQDPALGPLAASRIARETNPSTRAAAVFAAARTGQTTDLELLGDLLVHPDPTHRGNAAYLLGELGNPSAVDMLTLLSDHPLPRAAAIDQAIVRLQFAEALVKLGDDAGLQHLRASTRSDADEVRMLAASMLGRLNDTGMWGNLNNLMDPDSQPIQVRLAAAEALARIGYEHLALAVMFEAVDYQAEDVRELIERYIGRARTQLARARRARGTTTSTGQPAVDNRAVALLAGQVARYEQLRNDPTAHAQVAAAVRAQAAAALAATTYPPAHDRLVLLLDDPDPNVRLTAAAGVLQATTKADP